MLVSPPGLLTDIFMFGKKRGKPSFHRRLLDFLTTIEIIIYRSAVIAAFVVYAFKHLKAEWLMP
jgi:hypothetical protein